MVRFSLLSPKKENRRSASTPTSLHASEFPDPEASLSPELVPIVTLLLAQNHRRYYEGVFMLYYDLGTDGKSGDRTWKEVYGILTGNQLAYWDAANLAQYRDLPERLLETSSRPQYLNFTDAVFNAMTALPTAKLQLENVIVVLTTLKNRYIIQLRSLAQMQELLVALRLSAFEYQALQEAYTGALLSARGQQLSDIRTILSPTRYNHSEWVKIRYGSGTAWKRCYMVIEPLSQKKLKKGLTTGRVLIYETETCKRKELLGEITEVTSLCAVYPQLHFFIDKSTMMKLEGKIHFGLLSGKKSKTFESLLDSDASLFIMPEEHHSVPGYDTLIRFLVPLFDAFGQYGRPKRLKADRMDSESLLFGLPTLPCIYYLEVAELITSVNVMHSNSYIEWGASHWRLHIKGMLTRKLAQGYNGCGSAKSLQMLGGQSSGNTTPRIMSPLLGRFPAALSPSPTNSDLKSVIADRRGSEGGAGITSLRSGPINPNAPGTSGLKSAAYAPSSLSQLTSKVPSKTSPSKSAYTGNIHFPGGSSGVGSAGPRAAGATVGAVGVAAGAAAMHSSGKGPRRQNDLAEIYQNYTKLQAPTDQFNDRNKILNGSEEIIDETKLPTLMRKKSLMHGPYPTRDKFIGESDDDNDESDDESDESSEESSDRAHSQTGGPGGNRAQNQNNAQIRNQHPTDSSPPKGSNQFLAPNQYEERNASYSSVQSPNTQYREFNKQFSKNFANPMEAAVNLNNSDLDESESEDEKAPAPPNHGSLPKRQEMQVLGQGSQPYPGSMQVPPTPSLVEKFGSSPERLHGGYKQRQGSEPSMLSPAEESFSRSRGPNQPQYGNQPPQSGNYQGRRPSNGTPGQSMQSMQNKFQNTSIGGHEQQQGFGRAPNQQPPAQMQGPPHGQGPQPMPMAQSQYQQGYNMPYQQQRPNYYGQPHPQSGSPQQKGQYMQLQQRPPQGYNMPPRPQGYGANMQQGPAYGSPPGQGYRVPNPPPNQYPSHNANPNWGHPGQMQPRPGYGGPYAHNQPSPNQGYGLQPRANPYAQQSALSMRVSDDKQQYQYQVNPNFAPRRTGPHNQQQYMGSNSSLDSAQKPNSRYQ